MDRKDGAIGVLTQDLSGDKFFINLNPRAVEQDFHSFIIFCCDVAITEDVFSGSPGDIVVRSKITVRVEFNRKFDTDGLSAAKVGLVIEPIRAINIWSYVNRC